MNNSTSKDLTEDFWNDCMNSESPIPLEIIVPYKNFSKTLGKNNNKNKVQNKSKYLLNLYSFKYPNHNSPKKSNGKSSREKLKHKTIENSTFIKIYQNHPMLHENNLHSQEEKNLKKKKKNALLRCQGLYAYGIEVKKEKLLNDENEKKERIKEEIIPCTFKPKISKYSQKKKAKFLTDAMNRNKYKKIDNRTINTEYKISTTLSTYDNGATKNNYKNRNVITQEKNEISERNEEYTFHPKLYKRNINKVFSQSKSLANERDNDKFFLRYNKARENYMYKKMKQISSKDECYDTMLTIFHNFTNKHQRNKKIHYSMNEYKNDAIYSMENKRTINVDQNIIQSLRNELLRIDLNDEK